MGKKSSYDEITPLEAIVSEKEVTVIEVDTDTSDAPDTNSTDSESQGK